MKRICEDRFRRAGARVPAAATIVVAAMLAVAIPAPPAAAQSSQDMLNRIERMQQELNTLQQYVYRGGGTAPGGAAVVDQGNPAAVANLSVRVTQLEGQIQHLTGQNEEIGHSLQEMKARLDKLVTDVDARLSALERHAGIGAGAANTADNAPAGGAPPGNGNVPRQPTPDSGLAPGPQVLGQLRVPPGSDQSAGNAGNAGAAPGAPQQQASAPKETPEQLYARAKSLLLKEQDIAGAERLLREFVDNYPDSPLAASAHYWLGRTYFVRKDYKQAAFTFAAAFQKYPKSNTAPADLLNLGMSLQQLGKTKEACTAYSRLLQNFPKAEDSIKRRATSERKRAKCG